MNYKQLDEKMKAQIDILIESEYTQEEIAVKLNISQSTVSRYKNNVYKKRETDIKKKYKDFLDYLYKHYNRRSRSIEVCVYQFKKYNPH